ncbi:MAG: hypothetical protein U9O59_07530 [Actinomycetota bacterium]|nr:hypothetical protein [Actinomycetota bacterium]
MTIAHISLSALLLFDDVLSNNNSIEGYSKLEGDNNKEDKEIPVENTDIEEENKDEDDNILSSEL